MKDNLKTILKSLCITPANGQTCFDRQGQIHKLNFTSLNKGIDYDITIISDSEARITDFIVCIKADNSKVNLQEMDSRLKTVGPMEWKSYYLYAGKLPTPLNQAAQKELIKVLLKPFQGQEINNYVDERMTVVTAFSPVLEIESVELAGHRSNLQVSVRRDSITDVTYVYIGSPLILGDY